MPGCPRHRASSLYFADDDIKPCKDWLALHWSAFERHPEGYFFGGPIESEFEGDAPPRELLEIAPSSVKGLMWGDQERELKEDEWFVSANWSCPARYLRASGGFDVTKGLNSGADRVSVGEETDLMARLRERGLKAMYLPTASIQHFVPADKCTLAHIAERFEAVGWDLAEQPAKRENNKRHRFLGVPLWLYRQTGAKWLRWVWKRSWGQSAYLEYRAFRASVGRIRAYRHFHSAP